MRTAESWFLFQIARARARTTWRKRLASLSVAADVAWRSPRFGAPVSPTFTVRELENWRADASHRPPPRECIDRPQAMAGSTRASNTREEQAALKNKKDKKTEKRTALESE